METRRKFLREFKLEAVRIVQDRGVALKQAARDLGLNENMLRRWVWEFSQDPQDAFHGLGQMKPEQAEIARLQREVAKLKMKRDILKKAAVSSTGRCNTISINLDWCSKYSLPEKYCQVGVSPQRWIRSSSLSLNA